MNVRLFLIWLVWALNSLSVVMVVVVLVVVGLPFSFSSPPPSFSSPSSSSPTTTTASSSTISYHHHHHHHLHPFISTRHLSSSSSSSSFLAPSVVRIGAIFHQTSNQRFNLNQKQQANNNKDLYDPFDETVTEFMANIFNNSNMDDAYYFNQNNHQQQNENYEMDEMEAELAFRYAVQRINKDRNILPNTTLIYDIQYISQDDSFHAAKKSCMMIQDGAVAIFGPSDDRIGVHVQSVCDTLDIPHLEIRMHNLNIGKEFSINLHPGAYAVAQSIRVLITFLNWTKIGVIYENDINLIGLQDLVKLPLAKNVQFLYRKTSSAIFRKTLMDLRDREIYTMIVDIKKEHLMSFFTADLEIVDLEDFMYNDVNITAYRIVDYSNQLVRNILKELDKNHPTYAHRLLHRNHLIKASSAMMFDSVYAFARGLHQFFKSSSNLAELQSAIHVRPPPSPPPPSSSQSLLASSSLSSTSITMLNSYASCVNETPWNAGLSLYNYIDSLTFNGITGRVAFKEGIRFNMRLELLKLRNYRLEKVGEFYYSDNVLNITNQEAFQTYHQYNVSLRVTIVLMDPYVRRIRTTNNSLVSLNRKQYQQQMLEEIRYEGFCIDLLNSIAKNLAFTFEIYEVEDGHFGSLNEQTGEWRGLVRELIDKRADIAIAPLTISYARENVIDFTKPYMNLGIGILFKVPTHMPSRLFSFMSPLAFDIWLYVVAAYILVSSTLFIVARFSPYEWTNPHSCIPYWESIKLNQFFNLGDSFWFLVVTLMKQGCDMNPKSFSTRIIAAIWWFFTLILISSYTANLAAFLTVERIMTPIESVEDLARQSKIKYGTLRNSSTLNFFRDSKQPIFKKMWEFMEKHPENFVSTYEEGRLRVLNGDYAFLMESTMIDYMVQRDCSLVQIGGLLDSKGYGIATQMGSEWKDKISLSILELQEKGEIQMIYDKWWKSPGLTCIRDEMKNKDGKASPLGLDNIGGVFVVLLLGIFIVLLIALWEFYTGQLNKKRQWFLQHQQHQSPSEQSFYHYRPPPPPPPPPPPSQQQQRFLKIDQRLMGSKGTINNPNTGNETSDCHKLINDGLSTLPLINDECNEGISNSSQLPIY